MHHAVGLLKTSPDFPYGVVQRRHPAWGEEPADHALFGGQREHVKQPARTPLFWRRPAGTKNLLAMAMAVAALKEGSVERIILTRPAVEAGEKLGFLPGDLTEKVDPYLRPLYDALADMVPRERLARLLDKQVIEIAPLAFMRGRTLDKAYVVLDEGQNTTRAQMKMFLTRLGSQGRMVITGDVTQIDLPTRQASGMVEALRVLQDVKGIGFGRLLLPTSCGTHSLPTSSRRTIKRRSGDDEQPQRAARVPRRGYVAIGQLAILALVLLVACAPCPRWLLIGKPRLQSRWPQEMSPRKR